MTKASDLSDAVYRDVLDYGRAATIQSVDPAAAYDPATGIASGDTIVEYGCKLIPMRYPERDIDNTRILATDIKAVVAIDMTDADGDPTTVRPERGWRVVFGGDTYAIVQPKTYEVNGVDIAYVLQLRTV